DTVPFVPSPLHVVHKMLQVAGVKKGDIPYDMGRGDGRGVIEAAKKYGIRGIGGDLNAELVAKAREDAVQEGVRNLGEIRAQGGGPFPVLLDLHGGAWNNQDRTANVMMDESLTRSGVLVVAIDLTRAPEAPYPASVQDANYGVRWLKYKAAEWNGDPATIGAL